MDPAERDRLARLPKRKRPLAGWRADKWAKAVVDRGAGLCWICGCGGARQADHIVPVTEDESLALKLENARPAHGAPGNPCPSCSAAAGQPIYCNQLRGSGTIERARRIIAERIAANGGKAPPRTQGADPGRGRVW